MKIIELITSLITMLAFLWTAVTYFTTKNRERRVRTYDKLDKLFEENAALRGKDFSKDYLDYVDYVRKISRLATEYNERIIDRRIVAKRAGNFLIRLYDDKMVKIIAQQRKQFDRPEYFSNIDIMIKDLRK